MFIWPRAETNAVWSRKGSMLEEDVLVLDFLRGIFVNNISYYMCKIYRLYVVGSK